MSYLIKIGGSLTPRFVPSIFKTIKRSLISRPNKIFLFPGGGEFADLVRKYRKEVGLCDETTHKMALASLDQNAHMIADMCRCSCVRSVREALAARDFPVVIAPYEILMEHRPFLSHNLNIDILSSDSSAIYLAHLLKAFFVIATDVEGVYERDPKKTKKSGTLLKKIKADALDLIEGGGPLDGTLSVLIDRYRINTWVVNGRNPERLARIIMGSSSVRGTLIEPSESLSLGR